MIDFAAIGGHYGDKASAEHNAMLLQRFVDARFGKSCNLYFLGDVYIDMGSGPIIVRVGNRGRSKPHFDTMAWLGGRLIGINTQSPHQPLITIYRTSGSIPRILLANMTITSEGSGIRLVNGGSGMVINELLLENIEGHGRLDLDGWSDLEECGYAIKIENADGLCLSDVNIHHCAGHGIVASRLHAGTIRARVHHCGGTGFKLQQTNGVAANLWAEACKGFGVHSRDCGIARWSREHNQRNAGGTNNWTVWMEGNNGRDTSGSVSGYRFSQMKMESTARVRLTGHSGWRSNLIRLDQVSRLRNEIIEDRNTELSQEPDRSIQSLVNFPTVAGASNWSQVWSSESYRPIVTDVDGHLRITWPAGSFSHTNQLKTAWWKPFDPLSSPGSFRFTCAVKDVTGAIARYCHRREAADRRQMPQCCGFALAPHGAAITNFPLWDQQPRTFTGEVVIDEPRNDVGLQFNAWFPGMDDIHGNAPQDEEHVMDITDMKVWKL